MKFLLNNRRGFTLLELIVTLVISAIMGSMLVSYVYTEKKSVDPLIILNNRTQLQETMENISQAYKKRLNEGNLSLENFKNSVVQPSSHFHSASMVSIKTGEEPMLLVTLKKGNQEVTALFSQ